MTSTTPRKILNANTAGVGNVNNNASPQLIRKVDDLFKIVNNNASPQLIRKVDDLFKKKHLKPSRLWKT